VSEILLAGGLQMYVIDYLASGTAELQIPCPRGVDSIGIEWSGEERTPELEALVLPETIRRPLGWK
jgi:hypothetical protein